MDRREHRHPGRPLSRASPTPNEHPRNGHPQRADDEVLMGAQNVAAVFLAYPTLTHRAKLVLLRMALLSLDTSREGQPARRYFGGPDLLAEALGLSPAVTAEEAKVSEEAAQRRRDDSALRQVRKVLAELLEAGAIGRVRAGRRGQGAEYVLHLDVLAGAVDDVGDELAGDVARRTATVPLQEDRHGPTQEDRHGPRRRTLTVPPRRTEEPQRNTSEENITMTQPLTRAREAKSA